MWIVGASGSRKTMLAMSLGTACAAGAPWLGRPVTRCRVAGVWLEGSDAEIDGRRHALALGAGTTLHDLALHRQLVRYMPRLRTADEQSVRDYVDWLRLVRPAWVAVDNLSELGDITRSDPSSILRHVSPLARIAHGHEPGLPPITHVILSHTNASGDPRGGEAARQTADLIYSVTADSEFTEGASRRRAKLPTCDGPGAVAAPGAALGLP